MPYATVQQVARVCRGLPLTPAGFTNSTFVTADDVGAWLQEAEVKINALLNSVGGSAPYTTASAQSILGEWVVTYAQFRVYETHELSNGNAGPGSMSDTLYNRWHAYCEKIVTNTDIVLSMLGTADASEFLGHVEDNNRGKGKADFAPKWSIDQADTGF